MSDNNPKSELMQAIVDYINDEGVYSASINEDYIEIASDGDTPSSHRLEYPSTTLGLDVLYDHLINEHIDWLYRDMPDK